MDRFDRMAEKVAAWGQVPVEEAPGFRQAMADFMAYCRKVSDDYMEANFPTLQKKSFDLVEGSRWVKVVAGDGSSRSAWAFLDKTNGDVMKAAGWNAPAKHARANVFDRASWRNVGPYGPNYLRR